ncbi:MAG: SOS response-associated peptidase [Cytophagia bacterium]|nr:SOS response-associated peptidase [Cytophagia bacterium]
MLPNYSIASEVKLIKDHFSVEIPENHQGTYNAQPTHILPIVNSADPDVLSYYHWGIHPSFAKSKGVSQKLLFAPVEDILSKISQKKSLRHQRCIIPADSFYCWKDVGKKEQVPYRFYLQNNSLFSIAGIWDAFETEEGEQVNTFMMLTTKANTDVSDVSARMPAILNDDLLVEWLNEANTSESILEYVVPFNNEPLMSYTVNPKLADANFDSADLWKKVPPANQFGNLTLFS